MELKELIGRKIVDIRQLHSLYDGEVHFCDTYLILDNGWILDMPDFDSDPIVIVELDKKAESIFSDLSNIPYYSINKRGKSAKEMEEKDWEPYAVEYRENPAKHIQNRIIRDILLSEKYSDSVYMELDNGYYIYKVPHAMRGAGPAGVYIYSSLTDLIKRIGFNYTRVSGRVD